MKRPLFLSLIIALLLESLLPVALQAQTPLLKYTEFRSGGEMEQSRTTCFAQDDKGLLWIGTWIGLCCYDGKNFKYFKSQSEKDALQGSNRVLQMVIDSNGDIWCLNYDYQIYRFERSTSTFHAMLPLVGQLPNSQVQKGKMYALKRSHAVWITFEDGSMVRFDDRHPESGIETLANPSPSEPRKVFEIRDDSHGNEWVLTSQSTLVRHGNETLEELPSPFRQVCEIGGKMFLYTQDGRIAQKAAGKELRFVPIPAEVGLVGSLRNAVVADDQQIAYVTERGLLLYDTQREQFRHFTHTADGQRLRSIHRVKHDSKGRFWLFPIEQGVYCLSGEEVHYYSGYPIAEQKEETGTIYIFNEDQLGTIWVKPVRGALCFFDEQQQRLRHYSEALHLQTAVPDLHEYSGSFTDHQKNIWIAGGKRLYHFDVQPRQFELFQWAQQDEVRSMICSTASQGFIYGTRQGYLCRYDFVTEETKYLNSKGIWSSQPQSFAENGIYQLRFDSDSSLWVCTRGSGLYRLHHPDQKTHNLNVEHYTANPNDRFSLNSNDIYDVCEDDRKRLWIATFGGGLNLIEDNRAEKRRFININNQLKPIDAHRFTHIRSIIHDGNGNMLAASNDGVIAFPTDFSDPGDIRFCTYQCQDLPRNGLLSNFVMQALAGQNGCYISTYGHGVSRIEGHRPDSLRFSTFDNKDFPAGNVAVGATIDRNGCIWSVSECSLTKLDPETGEIVYYDESDFDRRLELSECQPLMIPDGRMLLGMYGGILSFDPTTLHKQDFVPPIVITGIESSNGTVVGYGQYDDFDTLQILPHQRNLILHFVAVDFHRSHLMRYAYRVVKGNTSDNNSEDEDQAGWEYSDTPEMNFANLAPGQFRVQIRSTNGDGVWCDNLKEITIIVVPTFWEKWGGWLILLLIACCVLAWGIYYTNRAHRKQEKAVKQEVAAVKVKMMTQTVSDADREFVKQVTDYFYANMSNGDLQVSDLADAVCMSRATFYRRLKQVLDVSPVDFVRQLRMRKAAQLLKETTEPVSQIAYAVGFNDAKYFSKCFKHDMGMSPAEYRNSGETDVR